MTLIDARTSTTDPRPTRRPSEPPIEVRVVDDQILIRPRAALDHDGLDALADAIRAAMAAGVTTVVDLEPDPTATLSDVAIVHGDGAVELPTVAGPWLLDVRTRRVCRIAAGGRRFIPPAAWIPARSVTITASSISVATATGERFTATRRPGDLPRLVA